MKKHDNPELEVCEKLDVIADALYSTGEFFSHQCPELAERILLYLEEEGIKLIKNDKGERK